MTLRPFVLALALLVAACDGGGDAGPGGAGDGDTGPGRDVLAPPADAVDCAAGRATSCREGVAYHVDGCGAILSLKQVCECGCAEDGRDCGACACEPTTCAGLGKACGRWDDGCGAELRCGQCSVGELCDAAGQCVPECLPDCAGRCCGDDGCGGTCADACAATGQSCDGASCACVGACQPLTCGARECGQWDDGCGDDLRCGQCPFGEVCDAAGQCVPECVPDCAGRCCGDDGCGGTCADACGAAGLVCDAASCACVAPCPPNRTRCGETCADVTSDPDHCGGCGRPCDEGQGCVDRQCVAAADCREVPCAGFTYCDLATGACRGGCQSDTQCETRAHCDIATHGCVCDDGYHVCEGGCVSNAAVATCGDRCAPCPGDPRGEATCTAGVCGLACRAGSRLCQGACAACPTVAGPVSFVCEGAACAPRCAAGHHLCGGVCIPTTSDPENCGGCDRVCPPPPSGGGIGACVNSVCTFSCDQLANYYPCTPDDCTDLWTDTDHCGGCEEPCGASRPYCIEGRCRACADPETPDCGDVCCAPERCPQNALDASGWEGARIIPRPGICCAPGACAILETSGWECSTTRCMLFGNYFGCDDGTWVQRCLSR